jgi:hypothetical protein
MQPLIFYNILKPAQRMLCSVYFPLLYMGYIYVNSPFHGVYYYEHKYEAGSTYIYI